MAQVARAVLLLTTVHRNGMALGASVKMKQELVVRYREVRPAAG